MNNCKTMRAMIEESIGRALAPNERNEMERHVAACGSCRAYREALLRDDSLLDEYASCHTDSVRSVEEKAAGARPAGIATAPRRSTLPQKIRGFPRPLQIAAAAAAAVAIIAGVDFLRGYRDGSVPAYASVLAKMEKAENVSWRERRWLNGEWKTRECAINRSGVYRSDYGDSITITNHRSLSGLRLYPAQKRAVLWRTTFDHPTGYPNSIQDESPPERLATWHKKQSFTFVRRRSYEGKRAAIYESYTRDIKGKRTNVKFLTWVDLDTEFPLRVEITNSFYRNTAASSRSGLRLKDFVEGAWWRPKNLGWVDLREDEPRIIEDNFRWNASVDTSFFSLNPPEGYSVQRIEEVWKRGDWFRKLIPDVAEMIRDALAEWCSLSGNAFPDSLGDMQDTKSIRPLLIAKYDKNGIPGDEYRQALRGAALLMDESRMVEHLKKHGTLSYVGKGCVFGDSTKVICWLQQDDTHPYAVIYADLHIALSETPPKPTGK